MTGDEPKRRTYTRGPFRTAVEANDYETILVLIEERTVLNPAGCWIWMGANKKNYPIITFGRQQYSIHRLALASRLGQSLGSQASHHMCGVSLCVNPDHLQPVSSRENIGEMLARNWYERRIRDLEQRLGELSPADPLLNEVSLGDRSHTELLE